MKKRILHVIGSLDTGGAENVAMNFLRFADISKYQCDYLVFNEGSGSGYYEEAASLGAQVIRIPQPRLGYRRFFCNVEQILKNGNYDIVHSHTLLNSGFVLKAAYRAGVATRISHSHTIVSRNRTDLFYGYYERWMRRVIAKYATRYVACSSDAGRFLYGNDLFAKQGIIIPNGIDASKYRYNPQVRKQLRKQFELEDTLVIGHVGRLSPEKNHMFLLDIFNEIRKKHRDSKLLIVGDGEMKNEINAKVERLGLQRNVLLIGNRDDVHDILQAMDFFVFPSLFEGFGIAAAEAQAAGLYCLVSDTVPYEVSITSNVKRLSISSNAESWADEVIRNKDYLRTDTTSEIARAGYDVHQMPKYIEELYGP